MQGLFPIYHKPVRTSARNKGLSLVLIVFLIMAIIAFGVCMISLLLLMGGSRELQNAVDAAALNVSRQSLTEISVKPDEWSNQFFSDVTNKRGEFNLENINHMIGKTLLIAINETAMEQEGAATRQSLANTYDAFDAAKTIVKKLSAKLNYEPNLRPFFISIANSNSVRMLGAHAKIDLIPPIKTSYVDRGDQSNVRLNPDNLPNGFPRELLKLVMTGEETAWLPGYKPIELTERVFFFVPQPCRPPHLISRRTFDANKGIPAYAKGISHPDLCIPIVPNAFLVNTNTKYGKEQNTLICSACAQADSLRPGFHLEMPHGFVRVVNREPEYILKVHLNIKGFWGPERDPDILDECINKCFLTFKEALDEDNAWPVFAGPEGRSGQLVPMRKRFWQRVREIHNEIKEEELDPPLPIFAVPEGSVALTFQSKERVHLRLSTDQSMGYLAPWLPEKSPIKPDGDIGKAATALVEDSKLMYPLSPKCKDCAIAAIIETHYKYYFKSGTGANGNLGDLEMGRTVYIRFLEPGPPPKTNVRMW